MPVKILRRKIKIRPRWVKSVVKEVKESSTDTKGWSTKIKDFFADKNNNVIFHSSDKFEINDMDGKHLWRIVCNKVIDGISATCFIKTGPDKQERQMSFLNLPTSQVLMVIEDLIMLKDHYVNFAFNPRKES